MKQLLYIDLFCGAGGTSTGVNSARLDGEQCAEVIACVNHDANAIASHASNHPDALHFTEDIRTLELSPLVEHLELCRIKNPDALTVLWASLECTNFSKAKGGQPRDADSRTLAEHLFRYIEAINPDYIQIENVEEFMSWGEVDENGKPLSTDKGRSYLRWVNNVKRYGFNIEDTHMRDMDRIARLVAMVCMALVWAYLVGEHKDINIKPIRILKHGRKAKSLVKYGLEEISTLLMRPAYNPKFDVFKFLSCT